MVFIVFLLTSVEVCIGQLNKKMLSPQKEVDVDVFIKERETPFTR